MNHTADTEVHLSGKLICASMEDVEVIKDHLPEHVRLTLEEAGCLSFEVLQTGDPLIWTVDERFTDAAAFTHHQQRTRASAWWTATAAIPRSYEITGIASK